MIDGQLTAFEGKLRLYHYKILKYIKEGQYEASISRLMKVPRTTTQERIKRLLALGLIKVDIKSSATFYKLTKDGYQILQLSNRRTFSLPTRKAKTRMHRLNVKFRILKDNEKAKFEAEHQLNNWIQKFTRIKFPVGITIRKTPKSIIAMFHEFETDNSRVIEDFFNHVMRGTQYIYYYCKRKLDIEIDVFDMEVLDQHIVNEKPELAGKIEERKTTTLDLNRRAKSYFKTNLKAKAWLDHSRGIPEIETNDFLYQEKLLAMPEKIDILEEKLFPLMHEFTRQIALHMETQQETKETMKDMRNFLQEIREYIIKKKK